MSIASRGYTLVTVIVVTLTGAYDSVGNIIWNETGRTSKTTEVQCADGADCPVERSETQYVRIAPASAATPISTDAPKPTTTKPKPTKTTKPALRRAVVRRGDTLIALAQRYGVSWRALYRANRSRIGADPNLIRPGMRLVVPKKG